MRLQRQRRCARTGHRAPRECRGRAYRAAAVPSTPQNAAIRLRGVCSGRLRCHGCAAGRSERKPERDLRVATRKFLATSAGDYGRSSTAGLRLYFAFPVCPMKTAVHRPGFDWDAGYIDCPPVLRQASSLLLTSSEAHSSGLYRNKEGLKGSTPALTQQRRPLRRCGGAPPDR